MSESLNDLEMIGEAAELSRVEALFDVQRYAEAENLIRKQLAEFPEDAYWLYTLARAQLAQDKNEAADDSLVVCLRSDPQFSWGYFLLSIVSHRDHLFSRELECAKQAALLEPEEPAFLQRLAEAHLQNGEIKKAKLVLEQLIKLEPDTIESFRLLGDIELELFNFDKAEAAYRQALKFEPENLSLLNDLARSVLSQKGKTRESIEIFYNMIQLEPTDKTIAKNLYIAIKEWTDKGSVKGQTKKSLAELPEPLQHFYNDYKGRLSVFESMSKMGWIVIWLGAIGLATYLFSLMDK